ncbi:glycoside hydrolase family 3 protein [Chytriomyces sp. MP71]|nr:glycoside hydrolase family 3 protein [Chytriomyces sp. MP71]
MPSPASFALAAALPLLVLLLASILTRYNVAHPVTVYTRAPSLPESHPWHASTQRARAAVATLSRAEKLNTIMGTGYAGGPCLGNVPALPQVGFHGLCLQDSPLGVRYVSNVTAFPAHINVAATFDAGLMERYGRAVGEEFRFHGVNVYLGPMMNLLRAPAAGRNWEGPGGDPYLAAVSASRIVRGVQAEGVIATAKHLIANEQEQFRITVSSNLDKRTLMEVYLPPFEACIAEGVGAIMCSYNRMNQVYTCADSELVNEIIRGPDIDFRGFVMTDWFAQYSFAASDLVMPGIYRTPLPWWTLGGFLTRIPFFGSTWLGQTFEEISGDRLDDMVTHILAAYYQLGQDKAYPNITFHSFSNRAKGQENRDYPFKKHAAIAREIAAASTVIVRNDHGVLPLQDTAGVRVAIVGEDARAPKVLNEFDVRDGNDGTLAMGWGSGTADFPYLVSPFEGLSMRGQSILFSSSFDNFDLDAVRATAVDADIALVFANADSGEIMSTVEGNPGDRLDLKLWHNGDAVIEAVASVNKNTVVVIHSVGPVDMPWFDHPNITGIVFALLPGQESGNALADVLFGDVNPSGRLPFTVLKSRDEYAADVLYDCKTDTPQVNYTEGLFIDYRHADKNGLTPLIPFGHGLSYTSYAYSNLDASASLSPWDTISVTVKVQNVGDSSGYEVIQLYVSYPEVANEPPNLLKGFERVWLNPGHSTNVTFNLSKKDLRVWGENGWENISGRYVFRVGASSRDLRLHTELHLE